MFVLDRNSQETLVDQVCEGVQRQIETSKWLVGSRLPSVRKLAQNLNVSVFTISTAYDRLVSQGLLYSRVGSGYFVAPRKQAVRQASEQEIAVGNPNCAISFVMNAVDSGRYVVPAGSGFMPARWLEDAIPPTVVGRLVRSEISCSTPAPAQGLLLLRQQLAIKLTDIGISSQSGQIVTTFGATHALGLICRMLVKPGDAVLVENPSYLVQHAQLEQAGARIFSVLRTPEGPDLAMLEEVIQEHRPKVFFTQTLLQNPTGSSMSPVIAYRLLSLAEKYGFYIVEDDVFGDLCPGKKLRLSSLDGLRRVFYVGSFTKVLSPALRVGFVACPREFTEGLVEGKVLSVLHGSSLQETLVAHVLRSGRYQSHLEGLQARVMTAHSAARQALSELNIQFDPLSVDGLFLWGKLPEEINVDDLVADGFGESIFLLKGSIFSPTGDFDRYLRFNAAYGNDPRLLALLSRYIPQLGVPEPIKRGVELQNTSGVYPPA